MCIVRRSVIHATRRSDVDEFPMSHINGKCFLKENKRVSTAGGNDLNVQLWLIAGRLFSQTCVSCILGSPRPRVQMSKSRLEAGNLENPFRMSRSFN